MRWVRRIVTLVALLAIGAGLATVLRGSPQSDPAQRAAPPGPLQDSGTAPLAGVAALALQIVIEPSSQVPTLGASGAIAGVLGGYLLLFPRARVVTVIFIIFFFTILELPALLVLGFWFLQQALFGYFDLANPGGGGGGVAYFAHIGGFVFGLLAVRALVRRPPPPPRTSGAR